MATLQRITRSGQRDCSLLRQKNYQSAGGDSKFMKDIEKWIHRIAIIGLLIAVMMLVQGNKQAQYMGLNNVKLIGQNTEDISTLVGQMTKVLIILETVVNKLPNK